jgi:hypothetical protein
MLENEGAGAGQDDGQGGSGAPSGGSPEGGSENDEKPITARQLKAALASQKQAFAEQMAAKDRELQAFKEGVGKRESASPPKVYTKADLKSAVDGGQITQEQADDIWDRQREAQLTAKAEEAAVQAVTGRTQKERIDSEIESYKRLKPEIMEPGSDLRSKVAEEYKYLTSLGQQANVATELAAIRAVVGPLEKLEKAASAARAPESEQQGGASGEGKGNQAKTGKKMVDSLKGDAKEFYERGIKSGRYYKDWDAVEAELKFASPKVKQRLGLPA